MGLTFFDGTKRRRLIVLIVRGCIFALYFLISDSLLNSGLIHPVLMFYGEKARLVLKGDPPRLTNMGFDSPPLPILMAILCNGNIVWAQSLTASFISAAITVMLLQRFSSWKRALPWILYLTVAFPILFLATQRFDLYLYFFLVAWSIRLLYQYAQTERFVNLFVAGPLLGATFLIHFGAMRLLPIVFLIILFLWRDEPIKIMPVTLTVFSAALFSVFSWGYIRWLFVGEAFGFLRNQNLWFTNVSVGGVSTETPWVLKHSGWMLQQMGSFLFTIAPYLVEMYYQKNLLLLLLPFVVLLGFLGYSFSPLSLASFSSAFLIGLFLFLEREKGRFQQVVLGCAVLVSLLAAPLAAFFSGELHERNLVMAFMGMQERSLTTYKQMAERLSKEEGKFLMDDATGYPLIFFMKSPERFILPYQYEFATALSLPARFADGAVIWKGEQNDRLFQQFGEKIKGFYRSFENDKAILLRRK